MGTSDARQPGREPELGRGEKHSLGIEDADPAGHDRFDQVQQLPIRNAVVQNASEHVMVHAGEELDNSSLRE